MSEEFARRLIEQLNTKINSFELQGTSARLALIIYRDSIKQVMLDMGHALNE